MGNTALFPTIVSLYKTFLTRIFTVERTTQNRNVFVLTMSSSDFSTVERTTQNRNVFLPWSGPLNTALFPTTVYSQNIFNSNFHRGADHSKPQCFRFNYVQIPLMYLSKV